MNHNGLLCGDGKGESAHISVQVDRPFNRDLFKSHNGLSIWVYFNFKYEVFCDWVFYGKRVKKSG